MEAEHVMNLFDSFWLDQNILNKTSSSKSSTNSAENVENQVVKESSDSEVPKLHRIRTGHTRSMSDQSIATSFNHESLSPNSVLLAPKLQTIFSGKEVVDSEAEETPVVQHHEVLLSEKNNNGNSTSCEKKKKNRGSKSLSDLEFEELKGFMDLGFVFSLEDKNSSLASIIPGLQRLGKKEEEQGEEEEEEDSNESLVPRPYLSEAWEFHGKRKKENPLMNWKVPSLKNEIDMKDSLRLWAHTVASTVR
ncbi:uncharacterized protein LOC130716139 [Lotus japonicus]|uniref:uncharacterized protein LOC130716139 n=1 Tax=Lotus japonicus TaxID=34305 RepID=UPI002583F718|nr:uncharacterized protein LOC130716139 [Lotus japonicus]